MRKHIPIFLAALVAFSARAETDADRLWNIINGKTATMAGMPHELVAIPSSLDLTTANIYGQAISTSTNLAVLAGVAAPTTMYLSLDRNYPDNRVWVAAVPWSATFDSSVSAAGITNRFISPIYGDDYEVAVTVDGTRVYPFGKNGWRFDYRAGTLVFDSPQTLTGATENDAGSVKISAYRYVGKMASETVGTGLDIPAVGGVGGPGGTLDITGGVPGMYIKYAGTNRFILAFSSINTVIAGPYTHTPVDILRITNSGSITIDHTMTTNPAGKPMSVITIGGGGGEGGGTSFNAPNTMLFADDAMAATDITIRQGGVLATPMADGLVPSFVSYEDLADELGTALGSRYVAIGQEEDPDFAAWYARSLTKPVPTENQLRYANVTDLTIVNEQIGEDNVITGKITLAGVPISAWGDIAPLLGEIDISDDVTTLGVESYVRFLDQPQVSAPTTVNPDRRYLMRTPVVLPGNLVEEPYGSSPRYNMVIETALNPRGSADTWTIRDIRAGAGLLAELDDDGRTLVLNAEGITDFAELFETANTLYYRGPGTFGQSGFEELTLSHGGNSPADDRFLVVTGPGQISAMQLQNYMQDRYTVERASTLLADFSAYASSGVKPFASDDYSGEYFLDARNHRFKWVYNGNELLMDAVDPTHPAEWSSIRLYNGISGSVSNGVLTLYYPGDIPDQGQLSGAALRNAENTFSAINTFNAPIVLGGSYGDAPLRSAGGNARGQYAVDLQTERGASTWTAADVASGFHAFLGPAASSRASGAYSFLGTGFGSAAAGQYSAVVAAGQSRAAAARAFIGAGSQVNVDAAGSAVVAGSQVSVLAPGAFVGAASSSSIAPLTQASPAIVGGAILSALDSAVGGDYGVVLAGTDLTAGEKAVVQGNDITALGPYSLAIGDNLYTAPGAMHALVVGTGVSNAYPYAALINMRPLAGAGEMRQTYSANSFAVWGADNAAMAVNLSRAPTETLDVGGAVRVGASTRASSQDGTISYTPGGFKFFIGGTNVTMDSAGNLVGGEYPQPFSGLASDLLVAHDPQYYAGGANGYAEDHFAQIDAALGGIGLREYELPDETGRGNKFVYSTTGTGKSLAFRNAIARLKAPNPGGSALDASDMYGMQLIAGSNVTINATTASDVTGKMAVVTINASGIQGPPGAELSIQGQYIQYPVEESPYVLNDLVMYSNATYYLESAYTAIPPGAQNSPWTLFTGPGPRGDRGYTGPGLEFAFTEDYRLAVWEEGTTDFTYSVPLLGPQGAPGANVAFVGTWTNTAVYEAQQMVTHSGSTWYATAEVPAGNLPTNGSPYWSYFIDGQYIRGEGLDFTWNSTLLGVKRESDTTYSYQDLRGPAGPKGNPGAALSLVGTWQPAVYALHDLVTYGGSTYYALQPVAGDVTDPPGSAGQEANWAMFTSKGDDGSIDYDWSDDGYELGIKKETESEYAYSYLRGPAGPQGDGLSPQGAWDGEAAYSPLASVTYLGSMYYALEEIPAPEIGINNPPTVDSRWLLFVSAGAAGPAGAKGADSTVPGPQGAPGVNARFVGTYSINVPAYSTNDVVRFTYVVGGVTNSGLFIPTNEITQLPESPVYPYTAPWTTFLRDGYTPRKGVDYVDGETPVKGIDYFDGVGLRYLGTWDAGYAASPGYSTNVLVTYLGSTYASLTTNNTAYPTNTMAWELFLRAGADGAALVPRGTYATNVTYVLGEMVYFPANGGTYYALATAKNISPPTDTNVWQVFVDPRDDSDIPLYRLDEALDTVTTADLPAIAWGDIGGGASFTWTNSLFYGSNVTNEAGKVPAVSLRISSNTNQYLGPGPNGVGLAWRSMPPTENSIYVTNNDAGRQLNFFGASSVLVPYPAQLSNFSNYQPVAIGYMYDWVGAHYTTNMTEMRSGSADTTQIFRVTASGGVTLSPEADPVWLLDKANYLRSNDASWVGSGLAWDGGQLKLTGVSGEGVVTNLPAEIAYLHVSTNANSPARINEMWFNPTNGTTLVYYDPDGEGGTAGQWLQASPVYLWGTNSFTGSNQFNQANFTGGVSMAYLNMKAGDIADVNLLGVVTIGKAASSASNAVSFTAQPVFQTNATFNQNIVMGGAYGGSILFGTNRLQLSGVAYVTESMFDAF